MRRIQAHAGTPQQLERIPVVGRTLRGGAGRAVDEPPVQARNCGTVRRPRRQRAEHGARADRGARGHGRRDRLVRREPPVVPHGHDALPRDDAGELDDARAGGAHRLPGRAREVDTAMAGKPVAVRRGEQVHDDRAGVERPHPRRGRTRWHERRRNRPGGRQRGQPDPGRRDDADRERGEPRTRGRPDSRSGPRRTVRTVGSAPERRIGAAPGRPHDGPPEHPPQRAPGRTAVAGATAHAAVRGTADGPRGGPVGGSRDRTRDRTRDGTRDGTRGRTLCHAMNGTVRGTTGCGGAVRRHGSSVRVLADPADHATKICGRPQKRSAAGGQTSPAASRTRDHR